MNSGQGGEGEGRGGRREDSESKKEYESLYTESKRRSYFWFT
jgi:hypothetical protein